jgi:hypothetical protein
VIDTGAEQNQTPTRKGKLKMNATMSRNLIRFVAAPVAAAGIMGGAALGFAALANASTPPACTYTGSATQCQTPGNVQINTQPGNAALYAAQQQYPFYGYGYGGLLFHHRGGHR